MIITTLIDFCPLESWNIYISIFSEFSLAYPQIDPSEKLDPEVEGILADIAEDFVESVSSSHHSQHVLCEYCDFFFWANEYCD